MKRNLAYLIGLLGVVCLLKAFVFDVPLFPDTGLVNPMPLSYLGQVTHWKEQVDAFRAREDSGASSSFPALEEATYANHRMARIYLISYAVLGIVLVLVSVFVARSAKVE